MAEVCAQQSGKGFSYGIDTTILPSRDACIRPAHSSSYPLPPKFGDIKNEQERSWWRVNACCIQETPKDLAFAYCYFFHQYLWPKEAGFLKDRRHPDPFHYRIVHDIGQYHFNAIGAPRHSCKSTLLKILYLLFLLTRRNYGIGHLTSRQKKYREALNDIRKQITNNPLILADFGKMKPKRGEETWSSDQLEMPFPYNNRLTGMSLDSRERGWHGELLGVDDAETDPDTEEIIPEYVAKIDEKLRFTYLSMVEIAPDDLHRREIAAVGRCVVMMGTVLGEQMVLNRILTAEPGGPYDAWNKWRFEQEVMGHYLSPSRWGKRSTEIQRRVLGEDAFDAEKQNRPGKSQKGKWEIHPLFHTYHIDNDDGFVDHPWESNALIRWALPDGCGGHSWRALQGYELVSSLSICILVDPHKIEKAGVAKSSSSDYTVLHVIGNNSDGVLWSLDLARGRYNDDEVLDELFKLCFRWKPTCIAMEVCGIYKRICDEIFLRLKERLLDSVGWIPYPRDLGPFNRITESKARRIERISWRFSLNSIRFPWWRKNTYPYDQCWHEVENFTSDLSKLKYDDIVDTIGLTPYVFSGPGGRPIKPNTWEGRTVEQLMASGHFITPGGAHLVDMLPSITCLPDTVLDKLERFYSEDKIEKPWGQRKFVKSIPLDVCRP